MTDARLLKHATHRGGCTEFQAVRVELGHAMPGEGTGARGTPWLCRPLRAAPAPCRSPSSHLETCGFAFVDAWGHRRLRVSLFLTEAPPARPEARLWRRQERHGCVRAALERPLQTSRVSPSRPNPPTPARGGRTRRMLPLGGAAELHLSHSGRYARASLSKSDSASDWTRRVQSDTRAVGVGEVGLATTSTTWGRRFHLGAL